MKNVMVRVAASICAAIFTCTSVSVAGPQQTTSKVYQVRIPEEMGQIKERYQGTSDNVVVHIQDAHTSFEAQKNLDLILEYLAKEVGVKTIAVEGAEGNANVPSLRDLPNLDVKRTVAEYFLQDGRLKGTELAYILSPREVQLFGAEDISLYYLNHDAFVTTLSKREEILDQIEEVESILNDLRTSLFSEQTTAFDAVVSDYRSGKLNFFEYCGKLLQFAGKAGLDITHYVSFTMLLEAKSWEQQIDFQKVDAERDQVIDMVSMNFVGSTEPLAQKKAELFERERIQFEKAEDKKGAATTTFYALLKNLATEAKVDQEQFKNFFNFATYISLFSRLDKAGLIGECKTLQMAIENTLGVSQDEKSLIMLLRNIRLMKDVVELKVLPEDVTYYRTNKAQFTAAVFQAFLAQHAPQASVQLSFIDEVQPSVNEFYEFAEKRSDILTDNTLAEMKRTGESVMPLVAGGYHTEGITKRLKEQGVSYIVVTPQIEKAVEDIPYLDRMLNVKTPFELLITSAYNTLVDALVRTKDIRSLSTGVPTPPLKPNLENIIGAEFVRNETGLVAARLLVQNQTDNVDTAMSEVLAVAVQEYLNQVGYGKMNVMYYAPSQLEGVAGLEGAAYIEVTALFKSSADTAPSATEVKVWSANVTESPRVLTQEQANAVLTHITTNQVSPEKIDTDAALNQHIINTVQSVLPQGKTLKEDLRNNTDALVQLLFPKAVPGKAMTLSQNAIPAAARETMESLIAEHKASIVTLPQTADTLITALENAQAISVDAVAALRANQNAVQAVLDAIKKLQAGDAEKNILRVQLLPTAVTKAMHQTTVKDASGNDFSLSSIVALPLGDTAYIPLAYVGALLQQVVVGGTDALVNVINHELAHLDNKIKPTEDVRAHEARMQKEAPVTTGDMAVVSQVVKAFDPETGVIDVATVGARVAIVNEVYDILAPTITPLSQGEALPAGIPQEAGEKAIATLVIHLDSIAEGDIKQTLIDNELLDQVKDVATMNTKIGKIIVTVPGLDGLANKSDIQKTIKELLGALSVDVVDVNAVTVAQETQVIVVGNQDKVTASVAAFQAGRESKVFGVLTNASVDGTDALLPVGFTSTMAMALAGKTIEQAQGIDFLKLVDGTNNIFQVTPEKLSGMGENLRESLKKVLEGLSGQLKRAQLEARSIMIAA